MKSDEFQVTESMGQYTAYELLTGSAIATFAHFKTKPLLWTDMLDDAIFIVDSIFRDSPSQKIINNYSSSPNGL